MSILKPSLSLRILSSLIAGLGLLAIQSNSDVLAEPLPISQLLPEETLLAVRVPNGRVLADRFEETSLGRMKNDPRMQPLIESLLGGAEAALQPVEERLGMKPLDALRMFEGELTIAIIGQPEKRPAPVLLMDLPADTQQLDKLLAEAEAALVESGAERTTEELGEITATVFDLPRGRRQLVCLRMDGRMLMCDGVDAAKLLLERQSKPGEKSLSTKANYAAIMNRCRAGESADPQVIFFADPIALARGFATGNSQIQLGLAFLPALGLDGLQGIGGTWSLSTENFDQVLEAHLLLDNPRAGAVKALALRSGDIEPESWVPANAAGYTTFHWDFRTTYDTIGTLVDSFQGPGAMAEQVRRRVSDDLGLDFDKDLLDAVDGRVSIVSMYHKPAKADSRGGLWGIHLKDGAAFGETFDKLVNNDRFQLVEREVRGVKFYEGPARRRRGELDPSEDAPRPAVALLENVLLITERVSSLEAAIAAQQAGESLAGALDYKLVASRLSRQPGGDQPVLLSFSRPEEDLRHLLELAQSEEGLAGLERAAERTPVARALHEMITSGKLPPAAMLKEYLAPTGALITDDETGLHYTAFTLKRK